MSTLNIAYLLAVIGAYIAVAALLVWDERRARHSHR